MTPPATCPGFETRGRILSFVACAALIAGAASSASADRRFFRPARASSVPAPSLATPQTSPSPQTPANPEPTPALAPSPTLAPLPTPAAPSTDAPRFVAPGVPTLKMPTMPVETFPTQPAPPIPLPPQTITSLRPTGDACIFIDLSSDYLNRLIATPRQDAGPVNDLVLGARVAGEQTTQTTVSIRTLPSASLARLEVVLEGETCTRTTAVTPQAAIDTQGRQRFDLHKSVEFDGGRFITRTPSTQLEASHQNLRARTGASQIPVVNSITETIVLNQANLRQPLARQETARRVTSRVVPPFNEGIDARLGTANDWLANLATTMPNVHTFLTKGRWSSTERSIAGQLAGLEPVTTVAPPQRGGGSVRIHESFAASLTTAARLNGREIAIQDVRSWTGMLDDDLSGGNPASGMASPPLTAPADASLRLADADPLLATYQNGEIRITLRASIRAGGAVELPIHRIAIGYSVRHAGGAIELQPLPVSVVSESSEMIVGSALEKVIQSQIESRLQPVTISPDAIPAMANGLRPRVTDVTSENGWLSVVFD